MDRTVPLKTLLRWSEALSGIARTGLGFTESLYEQERFEEILKVAADIRFQADEDSTEGDAAEGLVQEWMDTVGKGVPGYVTPKVAVGAAVGTTRGSCSSSSGRTRGSGSTRPAGAMSGTRRPRSWSKRWRRRPA